METAAKIFPHLNASLNALAAVLLVVGIVLIKRRKETAHKWVMISCFGVSVIFLICYLFYHIVVKAGVATKFPADAPSVARITYFSILLSHTLLAAVVPILAIRTIYLGLKDRRENHVRWARWTFPIWLYVAITGVAVYVMLYHMYPPT